MLVPKINEIQSRRTARGFSREKLSFLSGLPKNAIFRIETGRTGYTYPIRARAIAEALHCKVEDIFEESSKAQRMCE